MLFGLIGKSLKHSFSKLLFEQQFRGKYDYKLFELENIHEFIHLLKHNEQIRGVNVTIPYKTEIIQFLHYMDEISTNVGALNTILIDNHKLIGYNTDVVGFEYAYQMVLQKKHSLAVVLGTGGAFKAVCFVLRKYQIPYVGVSRTKHDTNIVTYNELEQLSPYISLIINTTPVGMYPEETQMPPISLSCFENKPVVIDLIYNPETTMLLQYAQKAGCKTFNGFEMLKKQAIESWKIWGIY